jgi:peptidoglycan LD-endopeptidase CwlK
MDAATSSRLLKLHPLLATKLEQVIADLAIAGRDVRVVSGLRTYEEQNILYAKGRSTGGPKVTNAKAGQSNHNFGLAADCCPFKGGAPAWNDEAGFKAIGVAGKRHGLNWGGDWKFKDQPHLELPHGLSMTLCRSLYAKGGLPAVWREADKNLSSVAALNASFEANTASNLPEPPNTRSTATDYIVKPGDNLTVIAHKFGTTVDAIKGLNGLTGDLIQINQRLKVK